MLPAGSLNQRLLADPRRLGAMGLAVLPSCGRVDGVEGLPQTGRDFSDPSNTPSPFPQGQCSHVDGVLPFFSRVDRCGGGVTATARDSGARAEGRTDSGVSRRQGRPACPSKRFQLQPFSVRASRPAATLWVNRRSVALPSVPEPRRSPAGVLPKGQRLALLEMSPSASSTQTSVAKRTFRLRGDAPCTTRSHPPAQHLLQRGFRVSLKTQKDTSCSRKS